MASNAVEALKEDFLHCPICTNRFKIPKILPCIHSFCQECLEKYVQRLNSKQLPCPVCREVCDLTETGVKGLQTNFHLINLAERMDLLGRLDSSESNSLSCDSCESTKASFYCLECNTKICQKCQNDHKRFPTLRSHSIIPINEIKQAKYQQVLQNAKAPFCDIHPTENLRFYCTSCSKLICRDCTIVQHPKPDHDCVEASSQLDEVKRDLLTLLNESSSDLKERVLQFIKTGKEGSEAVERDSTTLAKEVRSTYEKMMTEIEKHLRRQMEEICLDVTESKSFQLNMIDEKVNRASSWLTRLENTREVTQKVINENNMWEILSMSHDLISAFQVLNFDAKELQWCESEVNNMMVFSPAKLPFVTLGKCIVGCDVAVSDNNGNFILFAFDRRTSNLQTIRLSKDNAYDLVNADQIPPYQVEETIPVNAKITAAFVVHGNFVLVGLGRWVVKFNCVSNILENIFETTEEEDTHITFLGVSDANNTIYLMHSDTQTLKQIANYNQVFRQNKSKVNIESSIRNTMHIIPDDLLIEIACCYNVSLLYFCKEDNNPRNRKLYVLSQGEYAPIEFNDLDIIQNRQPLSVLRGLYQGTQQVRCQSASNPVRYVTMDMFTCYILWSKATLSLPGPPSTFIVTEYQSSQQKIVHTWNVSDQSAQPVACFKDSRKNQLMVCDLYGKVSTCSD